METQDSGTKNIDSALLNQAEACASQVGNDKRIESERRENNHDRRVRRSSDGSKLKVLIADDEIVCRKRLEVVLRDHCELESACNGQEAVEIFKRELQTENPFELIILDIDMPVMGGHQALRTIRQYERAKFIHGRDGVKIVMASSQTDSDHIFGAFRDGCEAYVVKPAGDNLLEAMVKLDLLRVQKQYSVV
jgi:two-component system chemotaxis response regulator CheY